MTSMSCEFCEFCRVGKVRKELRSSGKGFTPCLNYLVLETWPCFHADTNRLEHVLHIFIVS